MTDSQTVIKDLTLTYFMLVSLMHETFLVSKLLKFSGAVELKKCETRRGHNLEWDWMATWDSSSFCISSNHLHVFSVSLINVRQTLKCGQLRLHVTFKPFIGCGRHGAADNSPLLYTAWFIGRCFLEKNLLKGSEKLVNLSRWFCLLWPNHFVWATTSGVT